MPDKPLTISTLKSRLTPPSASELASMLRVLLAQWPNVRAEESDLRVDGYMLALRSFGGPTVKACIVAAIDGRIGRAGWLPLAPELAVWCREFERVDRTELARRSRPVAIEHHADDKVERRIAKGFENLSAVLARVVDEDNLGRPQEE